MLCLRNVDVLGRDRDGAGDDLRVAASFASIINAAQAERAKFPVHIVATTSNVTSVCKDIQQLLQLAADLKITLCIFSVFVLMDPK